MKLKHLYADNAHLTESVHGVLAHILSDVTMECLCRHDARHCTDNRLTLPLGVAEHDGFASLGVDGDEVHK